MLEFEVIQELEPNAEILEIIEKCFAINRIEDIEIIEKIINL